MVSGLKKIRWWYVAGGTEKNQNLREARKGGGGPRTNRRKRFKESYRTGSGRGVVKPSETIPEKGKSNLGSRRGGSRCNGKQERIPAGVNGGRQKIQEGHTTCTFNSEAEIRAGKCWAEPELGCTAD